MYSLTDHSSAYSSTPVSSWIAAIQSETGIDEHALLWSVKEYKKTRVRYYTDDWDEWRDTHLATA